MPVVHLQEKKLGPGTYEIKDFLGASEEKPRSTRGIIQTKEPRFKEKLKVKTMISRCIFNRFYTVIMTS